MIFKREQIKEYEKINELLKQGIHTDKATGLKYFSGYSYNTLYDWDQYFESIVQIYMNWKSEYIKNGVLIFLANQEESGFIPRHIPKEYISGDTEHVKPFLCQIALLVIENYHETSWILQKEYLLQLDRYLKFWIDQSDNDKSGLSEWQSSPHTGMDNQHERAGYWQDGFCEGVDLNSYLVREFRAFAKILALFGVEKAREIKLDIDFYRQISKERAKKINSLLWNEKEGIYFDRSICSPSRFRYKSAPWPAYYNYHIENERTIRVKSISCFAPMFSLVASKEQAERLVYEHLLNTQEFWTEFPVAALAKNEKWYGDRMPLDLGCNWRKATWIPTNYMLIHSLNFYGMKDIAKALIYKTEKLVEIAGDREWYDCESGEGCGLNPFWGWSLLAYFLKLENDQQVCICHMPSDSWFDCELALK